MNSALLKSRVVALLDSNIIVPEYNGCSGHPVMFSRNTFKALLDAPLDKGARTIIRDEKFIKKRIKVNDPYVLQDIDTKEDLNGITG